MKHGIVCYEKGLFAGWPANGGIWSRGDEVLVSYQTGEYVTDPNHKGHRIDQNKPMYASFSRSLDGGVTWTREGDLHDIFMQKTIPTPAGGFDFSNDGFILRVGKPAVAIEDDRYVVSADFGHSWTGPYQFPDFGYPLTSRTCYLIEGPKQMRIFMSYKRQKMDGEKYADRAFTALTRDGGQTWSFVADITDDSPRSVMPSVARLPDGRLAVALRRRQMADNWIEVRSSGDNGLTWEYPVRAGETAHEYNNNGNPPALVCLPDGRLVLVFGYRGEHPSIKARVSNDGGRSFGEEIILRDDTAGSDIGYPKMIVRRDGSCLVCYYYTSTEIRQQHIEYTIFKV